MKLSELYLEPDERVQIRLTGRVLNPKYFWISETEPIISAKPVSVTKHGLLVKVNSKMPNQDGQNIKFEDLLIPSVKPVFLSWKVIDAIGGQF